MGTNINNLREKIIELSNQEKFDDIIVLLSDEVLKEAENEAAEFYIRRGNAWYNKKDYDEAIGDYDQVIKTNPNDALALYNRGFAWVAKKEYEKAIADYNKVIEIDPSYVSAYVIKASVLKVMGEYEKAITNYNKAIEIDPNFANAYYNRGLAKKEHNVDLLGSKQDFEKYLELTDDENDNWAKYAEYYIESINEINDKELSAIADLVTKIKEVLLIKEDCITHYTSLSVLKSLILDNTKFRLSEGNFMNDPSEGKEFFNFINYKPYASCKDGSRSECFSPKPFIGSFVNRDKCDDLNMWRFYGKEGGIEAKGSAITLHTHEFIKDINNSLPKGEEDILKYESDINFYSVVYIETGTDKFYIPNLDNSKRLKNLMVNLKKKVESYKRNKISLEKHLNSIAFLFKSDVYKNENEIRLVVRGLEFEKKYNKEMLPPRVYIELGSIKKTVRQITLGPKVDKVNEWASAFHYSFEVNAPEIVISHLPYR